MDKNIEQEMHLSENLPVSNTKIMVMSGKGGVGRALSPLILHMDCYYTEKQLALWMLIYTVLLSQK